MHIFIFMILNKIKQKQNQNVLSNIEKNIKVIKMIKNKRKTRYRKYFIFRFREILTT